MNNKYHWCIGCQKWIPISSASTLNRHEANCYQFIKHQRLLNADPPIDEVALHPEGHAKRKATGEPDANSENEDQDRKIAANNGPQETNDIVQENNGSEGFPMNDHDAEMQIQDFELEEEQQPQLRQSRRIMENEIEQRLHEDNGSHQGSEGSNDDSDLFTISKENEEYETYRPELTGDDDDVPPLEVVRKKGNVSDADHNPETLTFATYQNVQPTADNGATTEQDDMQIPGLVCTHVDMIHSPLEDGNSQSHFFCGRTCCR